MNWLYLFYIDYSLNIFARLFNNSIELYSNIFIKVKNSRLCFYFIFLLFYFVTY